MGQPVRLVRIPAGLVPASAGDEFVGRRVLIFQSPNGELGSIGGAEFPEDPVQVLLDRSLGQVELVSNLFVKLCLRDKVDNLSLTKTQLGIQRFLPSRRRDTARGTDSVSVFAAEVPSATEAASYKTSSSEFDRIHNTPSSLVLFCLENLFGLREKK